MPADMTVKALTSVNPKIDLGEIDLLMALYAGGKKFDKFKKEFLIHREAETLGLADVNSRLKRAQYINRAAGIVSWIVSAVTANTPEIKGDNEYWQELNANTDGMGTPFSSLVSRLVADMLIARFPYVEARAIDKDPFTIWRRDPETVYDFSNNMDGSLEWIKTYVEIQDRTIAYAAPDRIKAVITYYTPKDTISYTMYKRDKTYTNEAGTVLTDNSMVSPDPAMSVYGHDFGEVPIFRGHATQTHWLMDRISEALKSVYNTEVDLSFSLSQCAYAQLIITLDGNNRADNIVRSEAGAWILQIGEKAEYLAPPNSAFDGLFKNIDRLKESLGESLHMVAAETTTVAQAGRMSGDAIREHRKPLDSIVKAIAWPIEDMLNRCLAKIADVNGYDVPKIVGLGDGPDLDFDELEGKENGEREESGITEADSGGQERKRSDSDNL